MPTQLVPNGVEVVFNAIQNGVPVVNIYHVRDTATLDVARLIVIANVFKDWWTADLKIILNNSYVLQNITVTNIASGIGPQVALNLTTGNQGDLVGEQVAGNAAAVMSWRTASIGRSFRGRTYIGGLDAAGTLNAQTLETTFAAGLAAAAADLITRLNTISATLSVLSRYAAGVLRVVGLLTEIIGVVVDTKIDSQRRRTAN